MSSTKTTCRICESEVTEFHDFGRQPLSDAFVDPESDSGEHFYRLAVGICEGCTMVQLMEEVDREKMFHETYPFVSGGSTSMREHFAGVARSILEAATGNPDAFVVEIGSNDGTMLSHIADSGVAHVGVEPSGDVGDLASGKGVNVVRGFFELETARAIREEHGPASVIYAANTLCHIPYMDSVFEGVDLLLADDGVMIFEDPYFGDIVRQTSFDQIYDEHSYLFTARAVKELARRHGLELVDVERLAVHGGEVRYTLARAGVRRVSAAVAEMLAEEQRAGLAEWSTLQAFSESVDTIRRDLLRALEELKSEGLVVSGFGATAKSATVLNLCGVTSELIREIYDNTPAKQGRLTPGSHIPVVAPDDLIEPRPDVLVLFAWNHRHEIMARETGFVDRGGKWLLYVPDVHTVGQVQPAHG